jgi:hypothetical protein
MSFVLVKHKKGKLGGLPLPPIVGTKPIIKFFSLRADDKAARVFSSKLEIVFEDVTKG